MLPLKIDDLENPGGVRPAKAHMTETTDSRVASLEIHVSVIKSDVSDIKSELRRVNDRIDAANVRLDTIRDDVRAVTFDSARRDDTLRDALITRIDNTREVLDAKIDSMRNDLTARIDNTRDALIQRMDDMRRELSAEIGELRRRTDELFEKLSAAKIWAILLYAGLAAGMLALIARAFKWV